ncbi:MAG: response regulator [Bacteroidales bacterium]|nr:response regulator [Bacteroidales bacterium]
MQRKFETEKKVADLQLQIVRNQLDPHFVMNAVNSIIDSISDENKEEARQHLLHFSRLQRSLLFLDIQMPVMSGFEVLQAIYQAQVKPVVIFVTAYDEFAIQAIRSSAFDYLLKPVDETELISAVERLIATYKQKEQADNFQKLIGQVTQKKLRFNTTGGFMLVNPEDIVYIQADWNYSEIHVSKDKHEVVTMNIGAVEELLPAGQFARISRSVIINLAYLEKVQRARRLRTLRKDDVTYEFKIPILRIRYLESLV